MEYLAGGEVKWRDDRDQPILSVEQTRRIIRDAVLGLEYRMLFPFAAVFRGSLTQRIVHHQGIIHRDIKPANLLWTEDRRQVKIADFGVSHFSYAQRLASAGQAGVAEDPEDPILLDASDLTRRAGTPSFLAPEIIYEHRNDSSPGSSSLANVANADSPSSNPTTNRPPITKAIDIWALGVTLYCLLFGKTAFASDPGAPSSEWKLYSSICNEDWTADETMGSDRIPTGGRHPIRGSEGATVIHLLDQLLQKDPKLRITLEEVKVRILSCCSRFGLTWSNPFRPVSYHSAILGFSAISPNQRSGCESQRQKEKLTFHSTRRRMPCRVFTLGGTGVWFCRGAFLPFSAAPAILTVTAVSAVQ